MQNQHCFVDCALMSLLVTHADGSRVSIAIIRFCDSVCLSVRTIFKPKRLKLKSPNLAQRYLAHQLILGQKVKVTGSQSVKALLLAARILEQPRSTAMLFQRGCSFILPPIAVYG